VNEEYILMAVEEAIVEQFVVLSWHLLGGTEDNNQKPQSRQRGAGPRSVPGTSANMNQD
jgi:hypothetical protein